MRLDLATGEVSTLGGLPGVNGSGDGVSSASTFYGPFGLYYRDSELYVTELYNNGIRAITGF